MKRTHSRTVELVEFTDDLTKIFKSIPGINEVFIGGSFCRGAATVGDLDFALLCTSEADCALPVYGEALKLANVGSKFVGGPDGVQFRFETEYYNAKEMCPIQVDVWLAEPKFWGVMKMFVAGSAALNVIQRKRASDKGFVLGHRGLTYRGHAVATYTEIDAYNMLGFPWLPYEKRNITFKK